MKNIKWLKNIGQSIIYIYIYIYTHIYLFYIYISESLSSLEFHFSLFLCCIGSITIHFLRKLGGLMENVVMVGCPFQDVRQPLEIEPNSNYTGETTHERYLDLIAFLNINQFTCMNGGPTTQLREMPNRKWSINENNG